MQLYRGVTGDLIDGRILRSHFVNFGEIAYNLHTLVGTNASTS